MKDKLLREVDESMMRDAEKTIGNLIDKQGVSFISSISEEGFPNMKAMLPPRKQVDIREFYFTTNTSSLRMAQYRENPKGCRYCYIHKGDARRGVDTEQIVRTKGFDTPVQVKRDGTYKMKGGQTVYLCFSSDFLLEDADPWRGECWDMIRRRPDLQFLFLTKRIHRFLECIPSDWGQGYDNVTVGCTMEDQKCADERLPLFARLPIKHKNIICQPLIGPVELERYLGGVELVVAGGEPDPGARPLDYAWVLSLREQCVRQNVHFGVYVNCFL